MLEKVVEQKLKHKGEKVTAPAKQKATNVIDLASVLQASIEKAQTKKTAAAKRTRTAA